MNLSLHSFPVLRRTAHDLYPPRYIAEDAVKELLEKSLILAEDWEAIPETTRKQIAGCDEPEEFLRQLVANRLITEYQRGRIEAGTTFGLVMGNYRILDRLGAGGMGVVFRAEHILMRRQVAIKVLPINPDQDQRILNRFLTEIRAITQLQHPNIVGAIDAGQTVNPDSPGVTMHFFVMEYVPGQDLEELIREHGPMQPAKACDLMHQVASALAEANKHNLVHRDIKPSNIKVTPEGHAKLLDFGLARTFSAGITEPGTLLGTLDYMAPEQIQDAHSVDIRADIFGLGGVLYWALVGQHPFSLKTQNIVKELAIRVHQDPPSICEKRPDLPHELDAVIRKMMARDPEDRYATPQAAMRALLPFLKSDLRDHLLAPAVLAPAAPSMTASDTGATPQRVHNILLVDDTLDVRTFCRFVLQAEGLHCDEVSGGLDALEAIRTKNYDLVILDVNMPDIEGPEVCRRLRENPPGPHLKIIMASGNNNSDIMAQMLLCGADDFMTKPFSVVQLQARVKAALRLKEAQDRTDLLNRHLLAVNDELEKSLGARDVDLVQSRNALVLALAKLAEQRASETRGHLVRLQKLTRCLAERAAAFPAMAPQIDAHFIEMLECCVPLHDIGKVGLPDYILHKPGKLDGDERIIMQTHTTIGSDTLSEVAESHGSSMAFLQMAIDIARHHHERYDGAGYPDRLQGSDTPLAARITAIADVYDALRSKLVYKPALSHAAASQILIGGSGTQFDPVLIKAFESCAGEFEKIFKENPD